MTDKYFQFPLCLLAYEKTPRARLDQIMSYSAGKVGSEQWSALDDDQKEHRMERYQKSKERGHPRDYDSEIEAHNEMMMGAEMCGLRLGSCQKTLTEFRDASRFRHNNEQIYGRNPEVRIRSDIFWDAFEDRLPYRLFAVLSAIYSALGNKPVMWISRSLIRCRTLGYKSEAIFRAEFRNCKKRSHDQAEPLTERQLRDALDILEERGFIRRLFYKPSQRTYFTNRLSREELIAEVAKIEAEKFRLNIEKMAAQRMLQAAIDQQKAVILKEGPSKGRARSEMGPSQGPSVGPR